MGNSLRINKFSELLPRRLRIPGDANFSAKEVESDKTKQFAAGLIKSDREERCGLDKPGLKFTNCFIGETSDNIFEF